MKQKRYPLVPVVLAVLLAVLLTACGGAGAGGDGTDGDGAGGGGSDSIPAASDLNIYVPETNPVGFSPWSNPGYIVFLDQSSNYGDGDGDSLMEADISGTPPAEDQDDADVVFAVAPFATYSDPTVQGFYIDWLNALQPALAHVGYDVVGFSHLMDIGTLTPANERDYTGQINYYEFWWVAEDLTITGSGDVDAFGGVTPQMTIQPPQIAMTLDLELKAGWNVVRWSEGFVNADMVAGDPPVSTAATVAPISSGARWVYGNQVGPVPD